MDFELECRTEVPRPPLPLNLPPGVAVGDAFGACASFHSLQSFGLDKSSAFVRVWVCVLDSQADECLESRFEFKVRARGLDYSRNVRS